MLQSLKVSQRHKSRKYRTTHDQPGIGSQAHRDRTIFLTQANLCAFDMRLCHGLAWYSCSTTRECCRALCCSMISSCFTSACIWEQPPQQQAADGRRQQHLQMCVVVSSRSVHRVIPLCVHFCRMAAIEPDQYQSSKLVVDRSSIKSPLCTYISNSRVINCPEGWFDSLNKYSNCHLYIMLKSFQLSRLVLHL